MQSSPRRGSWAVRGQGRGGPGCEQVTSALWDRLSSREAHGVLGTEEVLRWPAGKGRLLEELPPPLNLE